VVDWSGKKERERIAALSDPREGQEWFENLAPEMRADFTRHWRREQEHMLELTLKSRGGLLREGLEAGALFAFFDLIAVQASFGSVATQFLVGVCVGLAWVALKATRLSIIVYSMIPFGLTAILTRGDFLPQNMIIMVGLGAVASWIGLRREDR